MPTYDHQFNGNGAIPAGAAMTPTNKTAVSYNDEQEKLKSGWCSQCQCIKLFIMYDSHKVLKISMMMSMMMMTVIHDLVKRMKQSLKSLKGHVQHLILINLTSWNYFLHQHTTLMYSPEKRQLKG